MESTINEMYRDQRDHWFSESSKHSSVTSNLIGYFGAMAKWGTDLPVKARVQMLDHIIETIEKNFSDSEVHQTWLKDYKEEKEKLLAL